MSLNVIFGMYTMYIHDFIVKEEQMNKYFEEKAEEARKKYWDACNYPRKIKKRIRKEARGDYYFYKELVNPVF